MLTWGWNTEHGMCGDGVAAADVLRPTPVTAGGLAEQTVAQVGRRSSCVSMVKKNFVHRNFILWVSLVKIQSHNDLLVKLMKKCQNVAQRLSYSSCVSIVKKNFVHRNFIFWVSLVKIQSHSDLLVKLMKKCQNGAM